MIILLASRHGRTPCREIGNSFGFNFCDMHIYEFQCIHCRSTQVTTTDQPVIFQRRVILQFSYNPYEMMLHQFESRTTIRIYMVFRQLFPST